MQSYSRKRRKTKSGILGENIKQAVGIRLKQAISDLKTANNELQRDIEKKEKIDEMRKEFLANVSHELKTPIALIQGYAEGLSEGMVEDRSGEQGLLLRRHRGRGGEDEQDGAESF